MKAPKAVRSSKYFYLKLRISNPNPNVVEDADVLVRAFGIGI